MRQSASRAEIEMTTLDFLAESESPVGSARLAEAFKAAGIDLAEATAGRYLRQLDGQGLTQPVGTRGRVLTERGARRLSELRELQQLGAQSARLVEAAHPHDVADLIDLLYVRRAVEPEAARLAALRASDAEIAQLHRAAQAHEHGAEVGSDRVGPALSFHRMLVQASHNRLLIAMCGVVLGPANDRLENLLDQITLDTRVARISEEESLRAALDFANDHLVVVAGLSARDPRAAEAAMRTHLDKLIATAQRYTNQYPEAFAQLSSG